MDPGRLEKWLPLKQHTNGWIKILLIFTLLSTCALQVSVDNLGYRIHTKWVVIWSPDCFTFLSYKVMDTVFSACHDGSSIQELLFLTSPSFSSSIISISVTPSCSFLHFVLQDWQMLSFLRRHPVCRNYFIVREMDWDWCKLQRAYDESNEETLITNKVCTALFTQGANFMTLLPLGFKEDTSI